MTTRLVVQACVGLLCLAALIGTILQHREVVSLRAEHRALAEQQRARPLMPKPAPPPATPPSSTLTENEKLERLRLRAEVTQLRQRQQDLDSVKKEHDQLLAQANAMKSGGTNPAPQPPAAFVRREDVKMRGFDTPEAALESFVWALQRWDTNVMSQAVHPDISAQIAITPEAREEGSRITGFRIVKQNPRTDGRVELDVELAPTGGHEHFNMEQVNGQWRMGK